ncbi:MAG: thermonuclease family protein, partial [Patescibacteria group bacterium]|nr:thermonuclease family protein [Patescibacteria group bacterium]
MINLKKIKSSKLLTTSIALITLLVGFFSGNYYSNQQQTKLITHGTVTRIIDADTLELDNIKSVRLYAVSCPEKGEKFSDETIAYLTKTALNQPVTLDYQPNYVKDSYGRTLAYVFINGQHLNEQLIRQGFCEVTIYKKRAKLKYQDK